MTLGEVVALLLSVSAIAAGCFATGYSLGRRR